MKKKICSALGALALLTSSIYAEQYYSSDNCCASSFWRDGGWTLGVEWLYFLNAIDQPYVATDYVTISAANVAGGERYPNNQEWHSGYRIEGVYTFCNCSNDFTIRWTQLPQFSESLHKNGNIFQTMGFPLANNTLPVTVSNHNSYSFYSLEFLLGQRLCPCAPFLLELEGGLQYAHIWFRQDIQYNTDATLFDQASYKSQRYGIGPEIGLSFTYPFCGCFGFVARGYGSLLATKKESRIAYVSVLSRDSGNVTFSQRVKDGNYWFIMPYFDLRMGLSYARAVNPCGCCMQLCLEAGYEMMDYFKGIDTTLFVNSSPGRNVGSWSQYSSFMQHGPYVRLAASF